MQLVIQKQGGSFNLSSFNIKVRDFKVESPNFEHFTKTLETVAGSLYFGSTLRPRRITAELYFKSVDSQDYALLESEIHAALASFTPYYLVDSRQPGKRWRVIQSEAYEIQQEVIVHGFFTVTWTALDGVAESIATSADPKQWDIDKLQWGQGMLWDEPNGYYSDQSSFWFNNIGSAPIDMRKQDIQIYIENRTGRTLTGIGLLNGTTATEWEYTGELPNGQTLKLDGVDTILNGQSVFDKTTRKLLTFAPGLNGLAVKGYAPGLKVRFITRFYYL